MGFSGFRSKHFRHYFSLIFHTNIIDNSYLFMLIIYTYWGPMQDISFVKFKTSDYSILLFFMFYDGQLFITFRPLMFYCEQLTVYYIPSSLWCFTVNSLLFITFRPLFDVLLWTAYCLLHSVHNHYVIFFWNYINFTFWFLLLRYEIKKIKDMYFVYLFCFIKYDKL